MSTNSKIESNIIECKNCRQGILADKMFLHEGFCLRNNAYCEHCEKVFLKKDYDEHVKTISNSQTKKTDSQSPCKKSPETPTKNRKPEPENEHDNNLNNIEINENENLKNVYTPSIEYVQMPATELFQINAPIIIENGKIISNKNKNEFLLPQLGYKFFQNNKKSEEILDGIINQGDIFKENNNFTRSSYNIEQLKKILNDENNVNQKINKNEIIRESNESNTSNEPEENDIKLNEQINLYRQEKENKARSFINNINHERFNIGDDNPINIEQDNIKKKNSIVINNNIITYNTNKNISKIHNFYSQRQTPEKPLINNNLAHKSFFRESIDNNPLDKDLIKSHRIQIHNSIKSNHNTNISNSKEPKDSNSKKMHESYGQVPKIKIPHMPNSANGKINLGKKRCEYCKNLIDLAEINLHCKICKKRNKKKSVKKLDIPRPKKKDVSPFNNKTIIENMDGKFRDENNKEIINRQFDTALNNINLNNDKKILRGNISNPERKINTKKIIKDEKRCRIKKKLFSYREEDNDKDFPEDTKREEQVARTLKRNYKRLNNMSMDSNNIDFINENAMNMNMINSSIQQPIEYNVPNEEANPWMFYNNNNNNGNNMDKFSINIYKKAKSRIIV